MDLVAIVPTCRWLDFLAASASATPFDLLLGKVPCPPLPTDPHVAGRYPVHGSRIYLVAFGRLRCRVAIAALSNGVEGFRLELGGPGGNSPTAPEPVTIAPAVPFGWIGSREPWWKTWPMKLEPPAPSKAAAKTAAREPGDELPFPAWVWEGLPDELAVVARELAKPAPPKPAEAPVAAPSPVPAPPPPQRSMAAPSPAKGPAAAAPTDQKGFGW
jgi:hypothetical protein